MSRKVLFILTNHDRITDIIPTGTWLEEYAKPLKMLRDKGAEVVVASPSGGKVPIDPNSLKDVDQDQYRAEIQLLEDSKPLDAVDIAEFDAVYFPGGHGPLFDLPDNPRVKELLNAFDSRNKTIAAVCHGVAALLAAEGHNGQPLLKGKQVTGFANSEEEAVGLDKAVPYLLEDRLRELGADYRKAPKDFDALVLVDGHIITGQNPASSVGVAEKLIEQLKL
ncbi:MAG: type 1 glutamine amidotransferase domain-containing protein [Oligoflexus sp.]